MQYYKVTQFMKKLSLSLQMLLAIIFALIAGSLFGQYLKGLSYVGQIYVMLLQVVVYPYLISSIIINIARLPKFAAKPIFKYSLWAYALLVFLVFAAQYCMVSIFPSHAFTFRINHATEGLDLSSLIPVLIPDNIISTIANNHIPAVVVFSILIGISLRYVKKKQYFLSVLDTVHAFSLTYWQGVAKFAPIGIFALIASLISEVSKDQLSDYLEFLLGFWLIVLTFSFWLIPALIKNFTGISQRTFFRELQAGLILSVSTGISVLALPYIIKAVNKCFQIREGDSVNQELATTLANIYYPFAQVGNFFVFFFLVFGAAYYGQAISHESRHVLSLLSYVASIGSPSTLLAAVGFAQKWLSLPHDLITMFTQTNAITRFGRVLATTMGIAFVVFLTMAQQKKCFRIRWFYVFLHLAAYFSVLITFCYLLVATFPNLGIRTYEKVMALKLPESSVSQVKVLSAAETTKLIPAPHWRSLTTIVEEKLLRVGYNPESPPFSYLNKDGQLVGLGIDLAYQLASALNVRIVFVPYTWDKFEQELEAGKFDIAVSGPFVTNSRLDKISFSSPFYTGRLAFILPGSRAAEFKKINHIRNLQNLRIGVLNDEVLTQFIHNHLPNAKVVIMHDFPEKMLDYFKTKQVDAVMWGQYAAQAWALGHKDFLSIIPAGMGNPYLIAFAFNKENADLVRYADYWLKIITLNGDLAQTIDYWLLTHHTQL